jgi:hypothetical protein
LLRWVFGVEDREDHTRVARGDRELRRRCGRQGLDEVGLRERAYDDHERAWEPLRKAAYGVQRGENVRYPRLVEDRQSSS